MTEVKRSSTEPRQEADVDITFPPDGPHALSCGEYAPTISAKSAEETARNLIHLIRSNHGSEGFKWFDYQQAIARAIRDAREEALEEAAKECDRIAGNTADFMDRYVRKAAGACGLAIRQLKLDGDTKP